MGDIMIYRQGNKEQTLASSVKMGEQGLELPVCEDHESHNLPCRYFLYTVGPIVQAEKHCAFSPVTCPVWNWHRHAGWKVWRSAVYPTRVFCFPNDKAVQIAVQTVQEVVGGDS